MIQADPKISIRILEEKPVGYLVEFVDSKRQTIIAKKSLVRRIDMDMYHVENLNFLSKAL